MNVRRLISSGPRLARRFCANSSAPADAYASDMPAAVPRKATREDNSLYKRLSRLGSKTGTVTAALNEFIMDGNPVRKDELVRCVRGLRKYRRYQHALEIIEWMERRKMNFSVVDYTLRLDLIAKTRGLEEAENLFNSLHPSAKTMSTYGAMLNCYCVALKEEKAKSHFQKMDDLHFIKNSLPFTNMMSMYMRLGQPEKIAGLVDDMKQRNISPCSFTYSIWMQSCGSLNDLDGVEKILNEMINDSEDIPWQVFANLAAIYTKAGLNGKAQVALKCLEEKMSPRDRSAYHFLLSLYAGISKQVEVYRVWDSLKTSLPEMNNSSYLIMLQTLNKLNDTAGMRKIFTEWDSRCSSYDMRLANLGIEAYLKEGMYQEAQAVLDSATKRSNGLFAKARQLLMIHLIEKDEMDLAVKHLEAVAATRREDWEWSGELIKSFFLHFEKTQNVDGVEKLCSIITALKPLDADQYTLVLKTYLAAERTCPDMRARMEKDGIEINDELEELLSKVSPWLLLRS